MRIRTLSILLIALAGCKNASAPKQLDLNKMKVVMWDLAKAGEWYTQRSARDSLLRKRNEDLRLYKQVFEINGVTREQFFDTYRYYEAHPVEFKILIDSLEAFSSREKSREAEKPHH